MKQIQIIPNNETPTCYKDMPDGLSGYWWETEHYICVPVVIAEKEGDGAFSKWLRHLEAKGKIVHFPTVISSKLESILRTRGYVDSLAEFSDEEKKLYGESYCECLSLFPNLPYVYIWGNNPKRITLKYRRCRVLQRFSLNSAIVEFENGQREVVSRNALRKVIAQNA